MEMEFKLKWSIDGETRFYLGLAREMALARLLHNIYIHTPYIIPTKKKKQEKALSPLSSKLPNKQLHERKIHNSSSRAPKITEFESKLPHIMGKVR